MTLEVCQTITAWRMDMHGCHLKNQTSKGWLQEAVFSCRLGICSQWLFFSCTCWYIISMNHSQKIAPCLMDRHVAQPLNETAETNDSIVISNNWNRYKLHHVHPCLSVFNIGEIESHLLVNMQWSFELLQDYLQMSKTWETSSFDRVSVASSILLWTNSNIK